MRSQSNVKAIVIVVVFFAFGLLLFVPIVKASEVEIQAKEDADVKSTDPDTNFGDSEDLGVGVSFSNILISYIQFDITYLERQDIESISLRLRFVHLSGTGVFFDLSFVESNWVEESITYNSQPSIIEFTSSSSLIGLMHGDSKSFSLKTEYLDNRNFISFKLEYSSGIIIIQSKEAGVEANAPTLVINYPESSISTIPGYQLFLLISALSIIIIIIRKKMRTPKT